MDKKQEKVIHKTIEEMLKKLGVEGDFSLTASEESIDIVLNTNDTGIVIGYHGEVLESLQLAMSLVIAKKIDRFIRVSVEVGDYKKNRTEWLENMARQTKERVLTEQKEVPLPSLRAWERRIVHVYFQEDQDVISESVGVGKERTLVVRPRE